VIEHIDYNNLNYLDITIISLLVILALKGFVNGLIKELFGALGLIGGVVIASHQYTLAAHYIHEKAYPLENQALLNLAGFTAIVFAAWIIGAIVGLIIAYFANKNDKMGLISRLLGLGISGGKYFLLFCVVIVSLLKITLIKDNIAPRLDLNSSVVYPYIDQYGKKVLSFEELQLLQAKNFENSFIVTNKPKSTSKENNTTTAIEESSNKKETNETSPQSNINSIIVKDQ